jgi:diguanylate cyclase (GGDEF)-like protein
MTKSKARVSVFPMPARVALWYAIEGAFGGVLRDAFADPYWSADMDRLDERVRKRLRLLELADERHVPDAVKEFILQIASTEQLLALAEEAVAIAVPSGMAPTAIRTLASSIEEAFEEGGVNVHFDRSGKLIDAAGVDTTTKVIAELPNQKEFKEHLQEQTRDQIGVVLIDLDSFKAVNDTKGHPAGDACLSMVVAAVGAVIVGKGKLYRYGGDEFAVILRNVDADETAATAQRIRRAIEAAQPGGDIEVTASIGVAASDQPGLRDPDKLLQAVDDAVYSSKDAGKNRVTIWRHEREQESTRRTSQADGIKRLIDLAEFGVHKIQNDPQNDSAEALNIRRDVWEQEVLAALEEAGATQSQLSTFRVLGTFTSKGLQGKTQHHGKIVNEAAEKIGRLRIIAEQLEARLRRR